MKILIVDDSVFARSLIIRSLSICGLRDVEFKEASNGEDALTMMKSESIDLVFTDLNMPDMDGEELLIQIKSDPSFIGVPVVIITSNKNQAKEDKLMLNNAAAVLQKPLALMDLHDVITNTIGINRGADYEA